MDKFMFGSKSNNNLNTKNELPQETFLNKFRFLGTLKEYILSKLRSAKYNLTKESKPEVNIVSYEQKSFFDVEKELDLQTSKTPKIDREAIEDLKKVLNSKIISKKPTISYELLEIAEKTFARQLDIFEEILKFMKSDDQNSEEMQKLQNHFKGRDESMDNFINNIIKNIIIELKKSDSDIELVYKASKSELIVGDNCNVKTPEVLCECQQPTSSGAAVPKPRKNILELHFENPN